MSDSPTPSEPCDMHPCAVCNPKASETPRTDAVRLNRSSEHPSGLVPAEKMEELERELNNMTDQRDAIWQTLERMKKNHERELDEQCRLNGMGSEREAKLRTELFEAREKLNNNRRMVKEASEAFIEARKQRDQMEAALAKVHKDLGFELKDPNGTIWEHAAKMQVEIGKLKTDLDDALRTIGDLETRHAAVMLHTQTIVDEANNLRKQRDRLEEALREADELLAHAENTLHGDGSDDVTAVRMVIGKSLAVKGGTR